MASQAGSFNVQELSDTGAPLSGGRLYTFSYGTTTQKTAYTDAAGTIPHTYTSDGAGGQYIALNSRGELPAPLYLGSGSYDLALKRSDGSSVWTRRADGQAVLADLSGSTGSALVGYISSATGATSRTVQAKLRDFVSVKDFGAVGDGVADDTAAITAAIGSGALQIYFPPGTYNTSGGHSLNGRNGLQLIGAGVGAAILNITHASNNLFTIGATVTNNLLISGFTVTSTSVTRTGGWVFAVLDAYNSTGALSNSNIRDLQIMKQVNGLWIAKYQFVNVEDVLMYSWVGASGIGLKVGQTTTTNVNQGSQCY
jgi:hypothetical protein